MKKFAIAALAVTLSLGTMTAISAPAAAQSFGFSFNTGDVAFAYRDGYYDRYRNWHAWRSPREAYWYRRNFGHNYYDGPRNRYRNMGWRDEDRDGVPNRYDRDRDGDGVPNRYDRRPDNPYRP
jgi:hypothetical protein